MKHAPIVALALAAAFVAGCGGGSSTNTRNTDLEDELADLQKEISDLKGDIIDAEQRVDDESDRADGESDRADRAEGQRDDAQDALGDAESRADDLEEEAGHTADQLVQANARQVLAGLDDFVGDAPADGQSRSASTQIGTTDPAVTPRHRESALVTTAPPVTFPEPTTGMSGNWFKTSFSNRAFDFTNRLDVYSDAEAPEHVSFRESVYNDGVDGDDIPNTAEVTVALLYQSGTQASPQEVIDSEGDVVGSLDITGDTVSGVVSSPFPRSGDGAKSFTLVDRGYYTREQINDGREWYRLENDADLTNDPNNVPTHCGTACDASGFPADPADTNPRTVRNEERYPWRFSYEASGSLAGASGTFTCASATMPAANACRVTNQNTHFLFAGPWVFTPSAGARVRVDDAEFMYFGWWARQDNSDGSWTYRTFHGPAGTAGNRSTAAEIAQLSGTATYQGRAVGQYSFYEPLGSNSEYGEFTARATLTANFTAVEASGDETVHGTIDQFVGHPDWTLTLKQRDIVNGVIPVGTAGDAVNAVSWSIEDEALAAPDSGTWEAAFYSNLPADKRGGTDAVDAEDAVPTGIAGTFEAEYHHVGRIIGAFGAHKEP